MIKVLLADDSAFMRKVISDIITRFPGVEVTKIVRNGALAVEAVQTEIFDVVILDVEMPVMDGLTALKGIKAVRDIPVIMLSALNNQALTIAALEAGAFDFIEKPLNLHAIDPEWLMMFADQIIASTKQKGVGPARVSQPAMVHPAAVEPAIIVIGASTGGPKALLQLIQGLPAKLKMPILIVQHMPKGFTTHFANRLHEFTANNVYEAADGMIVENAIYLAPGDYHMEIIGGRIKLHQAEKMHGTRPAVDYLFKSAAAQYGARVTAFLLTGMGHDGADGMATIKQHGGYNITQDEATCIVYGMPKSAVALKVVDEELSLAAISTKLNQLVGA
ncbi:chemotaxis-specific protein-glutamate methyltransferase CheB [Periweissella ghanensis]|uniref:Protein-glutamate methylesterase/protein-glutamine glutaminase n=1 Tax=Periweissella ghanensis TaxID=467997 RepID=A0ABM8ZB11_9LACO|nr:chemotaxis-specific protein-glutamate methyltransferase CheB [Periweissella ghanensis]MCM0601015.1 chemotaxis-specific protein-glutamate methyltransferase CheB [Periweissella ghanensis]CAH0417904.1 Protein-glutamate methylesterase/protein-glutamine glutaminase [Periweissella ghanensis]